MSSESIDPLAKPEDLISAINEAEKPVAFLVGSPLSMADHEDARGVPGVKEMVALAIEQASPQLRPRLEAAISSGTNPQRYQNAMMFLRNSMKQSVVNAVVRKAVLQARSAPMPVPAPSDSELEKDVDGWYIPAATRDLGAIVVREPEKFGPILTTNFDPLLKLAIRRAGGKELQTILHADGDLNSTVGDPHDRRIIYLHGYWTRFDTLHSPEQLATDRPLLLASIQQLLREYTLVVVGYGGWDDIFTRALAQLGHDTKADIDILWAFYESEADLVSVRYKKLFSSISSGSGRGRFRKYGGIDCHSFFRTLLEARGGSVPIPAGSRAESVGVSPLPASSVAPAIEPRVSARAEATPSAPLPKASVVPTAEPRREPIAVAAAAVHSSTHAGDVPRAAAPSQPTPPAPAPAPSAAPTPPKRTTPVLPLVAFGGVLLAVGFAVTNNRPTTTTEPPPAVVLPIGTPKEPSPSERDTHRTPAGRVRVPKETQPGPPSNTGTRPGWDAIGSPQPAPTTRGDATVESLRSQNRVNALTRGPTGFRAAQLPLGTFGFIPMDSVTMLQSASVEETPVPSAFEVHKTNAGSMFLLGYVHEATAKAINAERRVNAVMMPAPAGVRTQLVSIPFNRISTAELRMDSGNKVLLLELAGR